MHEFATKFVMASLIALLVIIAPQLLGNYGLLPFPAYVFIGVFTGTLIGMIPSRVWKTGYRSF